MEMEVCETCYSSDTREKIMKCLKESRIAQQEILQDIRNGASYSSGYLLLTQDLCHPLADALC